MRTRLIQIENALADTLRLHSRGLCDIVTIGPATAPCSTRSATSIGSELAKPHSSEASAKPSAQDVNTRTSPKRRANSASTTRNPFGTAFAVPSAFTSTAVDQSVPITRAYFAGSVASSICRQVLLLYSVDSDVLAARTISFPRGAAKSDSSVFGQDMEHRAELKSSISALRARRLRIAPGQAA